METTNISTNKANTPEETIGEIVAKDYRKAQVFKKFGIDFCCGGKKTLAEASEKKGIDPEKVKKDLAALDTAADNPSVNFDKWEIDFLIDYIIHTHHRYVKESIPFISGLSQKVASVHGESHPELRQVAIIFDRIAIDLSQHMMKEENDLFPHIRELVDAMRSGGPIPAITFEDIAGSVELMETEHEQAGKDLEAIRKITADYQLPAEACTSYRVLYKNLEEFGNDLHKHVHLENNILFPKAIRLETEL